MKESATAENRRAAELRQLLEEGLGIPFTEGNRITPLHNGVRIFPAMLEAIAGARRSIEFQTFIYWQGAPARWFADALAARARDGVAVRVLLDAVGAAPMDRALIEEMTEAGIEVRWFRPPIRWKIWQADNRSHRKILVVDRTTGFTGGVGIAEEWDGDARNAGEWRETHFRLEGPIVQGLTGGFLANWMEAAPGAPLPSFDETPSGAAAGSVPIQVVRSAAAVGWSDVATLLKLLITGARERIRICTAYFVPGPTFSDALLDAARRGVTVEVMLPALDVTDSRVSRLCGAEEIEPLLKGGVNIWLYEHTNLHLKTITVDGCLACVGSANVNQRSIHKDDELSVNVLDRDFTAGLDRDFDDDLHQCRALKIGDWKRRGLLRRALEVALSPLRQES